MFGNKRRIPILGAYTASDLQLAMRVVLARAGLRRLRNHQPKAMRHAFSAPIGCDVRPNGTIVRL